VASWHVGLTEQSRQIMVHLRDNFTMHQVYKDAIDYNLKICGLPKSPLVETKSAPAVHISRKKSDFDLRNPATFRNKSNGAI
jgi:hypothetical protein